MNFNFRSNHISDNVVKKALITIFALLNLIFFCPDNTLAQLDPAFGTNGVAGTDILGYPLESLLLPDGKILVISEDDNSLTPEPSFVRFNSDGTLDDNYGTNGAVRLVIPYLNPASGQIVSVVRQVDGKILLAGFENDYGIITRFHENGTLDTSFANNGIYRTSFGSSYDVLQNIILLPDGKILVVGSARDNPDSGADILFIRYSADGVLDQTFGNGNGYLRHQDLMSSTGFGDVKALRQSDGKLVVFRTTGLDYNQSTRIRRFNADGTLDNTYPDILLNGAYSKVALQSDDKLLVGGAVNKNDALERRHKDISILRYTASGSLDLGFGTNGNASFDITSYFDDTPKALRVMPDGQILVGALTHVPLNRSAVKGFYSSLARLSADGNTVNGKFLQTYTVYNDWRTAKNGFLKIQPDGKILTVYQRENTARPYLLLARAVDVPVETYRFKGLPFDFNYSPYTVATNPATIKATAEVMVFRSSNQRWYTYGNGAGYFFGLSDDIPVPSDYVGNFETDLAVFRPGNGTWYIAKDKTTAATDYIAVPWGTSGDIPAPADFDGDGKSDIAVFRPSTGVWYIRSSSDNSPRFVQWGSNGDKPVAGDYDGDGFYDVAVWRPSNGTWYILRSSDGQASFVNFGLNGDVPVQEDFDGDGITDIAVWRPSTGVWYVLKSSDGNFLYFNWGTSGDIAVPADYDGDFKTDFAVWRPSTGHWYLYRSSDNSYAEVSWGLPTDIPVQGKN